MADYSKTHGAVGRQDLPLFDPDDLIIVGLDTDDGSEHPLYDPSVKKSLDESFLLSVRTSGVLEPILVWKDGEDDAGKPRVIVLAGRDRTRAARAAKEAGIPIKIPGIVKRGTQAEVFRWFIEENTQRRGKDSPLVLARKIERARSLGNDDGTITHMFRISVATIETYLSLLDAHEKVRSAVDTKQIAIGAAVELLKLPAKQQPKALDEILQKGGRVHAAKNAVAKEKGSQEEVRRPISKREISRLSAALEKTNRDELGREARITADVAAAVLAHVQGDDDALAPFPVLLQARLTAEDERRKQKVEQGKKVGARNKKAAE